MTALKLIYDKLKSGEIFGKIEKFRLGGTFFWEVLWMYESMGKSYIGWRHFGSSANTVSLQNLKWILTEIFKTTPEQFLFDYTTYHKWCEIDNAYDLNDTCVE